MLINLASQYAPWLPDRLFANGQQGVWYVPQPVYRGQQVLFQDAAGTTPVTADGDPVGWMRDFSGNGNHASQSTSAARPIYRTDGALHRLQVDGVDDIMTLPQASIPPGGALRFTSFAMESPGSSGDKLISFGTTASGQAWRIGIDIGGEVRVEVQGDNVIGTTKVDNGLPHIVTVYTTGASLSDCVIRVDGQIDSISSPGSAAINTDSTGLARLFTREDEFSNYSGDIFGIVHRHSVPTTQDEIDVVENYLANLAGVTL